jgi:hypothetical protein
MRREIRYEIMKRSAEIKMARYDALPPYKRSFVQRNSDLFSMEEVRKMGILKLRALRKLRIQQKMCRLYGKDHPSAGGM